MLILSIDVGIKNLAVCISDISGNEQCIKFWDIINLCNEETHTCCECTKEAKYTKNENSIVQNMENLFNIKYLKRLLKLSKK